MTAATGLPDGLKEQSHSLLPGISLDFLKLPKASSGHNISLDFLKLPKASSGHNVSLDFLELPKASSGHNFMQVHINMLTFQVWQVRPSSSSLPCQVVACNFVD